MTDLEFSEETFAKLSNFIIVSIFSLLSIIFTHTHGNIEFRVRFFLLETHAIFIRSLFRSFLYSTYVYPLNIKALRVSNNINTVNKSKNKMTT